MWVAAQQVRWVLLLIATTDSLGSCGQVFSRVATTWEQESSLLVGEGWCSTVGWIFQVLKSFSFSWHLKACFDSHGWMYCQPAGG